VGLGAASLFAIAFLPLRIAWTDGSSLAGWSNYGQTFGIISGLFAAVAFIAALYTIKLQREQIAEANAHNEKIMGRQEEQIARMKQTAEIQALAAMLQTCERFRTANVIGDKQELENRARTAMQRLEEMLNLIQQA
jgi:hypothetical protein